MHFLLLPFGSAGDVNPFLGLAAELQRRGHQVVIGTNGYFLPRAEAMGLEAVELGTREMYLNAINDPNLWHPTRGTSAVLGNELMGTAVRNQFELIQRLLGEHPDLVVVAGTLAFGAHVAGEALRMPLAVVHLQPTVLRSMINPPRLPGVAFTDRTPRWFIKLVFWIADHLIIDRLLRRSVGKLRRELGLPAQRRYFGNWIHGTGKAIGLWPDWFASAPDWPANLKLTGFPRFDGTAEPLSPIVEEFLAGGSPPVVVTFGSAMKLAAPHFRAAIEAIGKLGRRAIVLTPFQDQLPAPLPPHVLQQDYVSLRALLPRCAALIHHGGIGTMSQALATGVPQIIMPLSHDQPENAMRIEQLGVGFGLPPAQFTAKNVADRLSRLIDDPLVQQQCREIARRFEHDTALERTVNVLESLR